MQRSKARSPRAISGKVREVHVAAVNFRSMTRQWESALKTYIEALQGLNKSMDDRRTQ